MEIVGVMHGYDTYSGFQPVSPSKNMEEIISDLPLGTKVGIEIAPKTKEYLRFVEKLSKKGISLRGQEYFESIKELCDSRSLETIYLEDVNQFIKQNEYYQKYAETNDFSEFMNYFNQFAVERDAVQINKIKENHPAISFVGIGHVNKWHFENTFDNATYSVEVTDGVDDRALFDKSPEFSKRLWQLDKGVAKLCNLYFKKQFSAKNPDFVGSWDPNNLIGYFEIYLKNGKGTIEDFLGTANIEGKITEEEINFVKKYSEGAISYIASPIKFFGRNKQGNFSSNESSGKFNLFSQDLSNNRQFYQVFEFLNEHLSEWSYDLDKMRMLREEQYLLPPQDITFNLENEDEDDLPF